MKFPVLQSFEKDLNKIVFVINQLSRGLDELIASGGGIPAGLRQPLTADTTFYVAPAASGGSDSNTGLIVGSPWLTLQHAYDTIVGSYDFMGKNVTIQLANATGANAYTRGLLIQQPWTGGGIFTIRGDPTTPANVLFNLTTAGPAGGDGGNCIYANVTLPSVLVLTGMKFQTSVPTVACIANNARGFIFFTNINFGPTNSNSYHIACYAAGGFVQGGSAYTISGGARLHYYSTGGWIQVAGQTCTIVGNPVPTFLVFAYSYSTSAKVDVLNETFVDHNGHGRKSGTGTTHSSTLIDALSINTNTLSVGMVVTGTNIPAGATIATIPTAASITISAAAADSVAGKALKFEIAKGQKYFAIVQAAINANGAGADYLPGDTAGSADAATYAVYV